jgi:hypothetical protein
MLLNCTDCGAEIRRPPGKGTRCFDRPACERRKRFEKSLANIERQVKDEDRIRRMAEREHRLANGLSL